MTAALYAATVLFWGSSWYAMAVQAAYIDPVAGVFHRIGLAAVIFIVWLGARGRLKRRPLRDHLVFMGQGVCLFGLNFVIFYTASHMVPSAMLAICFATATLWAAIFSRIFYGAPLSTGQLLGAALGVGGLVALSSNAERLEGATLGGELLGLGLALLGAVVFALGNMLAEQLRRRRVPQSEGVAWGMGYGALGVGATALALGQSVAPPVETPYWIALLYLSTFASVIAFTTYLTLVERLGAARAAYSTVLFPLVALAISAVAEDFHPTLATLLGFAAILIGAALALRKPAVAAAPKVAAE